MSIKVSGDIIIFSKPFSLEEMEIGNCLGFKVDQYSIEADITKTSKVAIMEFMKRCFPNYVNSQGLLKERNLLYAQIKKAYDDDYKKFIEFYRPENLYDGKNKLDKYQIDSLYVMRNRQSNLFAAEQGSGKTVSSASISKMNNYKRTIVVSIAAPKFNWRDDLCKNWGFDDTSFTMLDANKSTMSFLYEKFVITNYESVEKFFPLLTRSNTELIIFDECEKIKSTKSLVFKNAQKLVNHFPNAKIIFMSGTPIRNNILDMFAYLKLAKHPLGSNFESFKARFWDSKNKRAKNVDLFRIMTSNFTVRVKLEDHFELPDLKITKSFITTEGTKKEYANIVKEMYDKNERFKWLESKIIKMTSEGELSREDIELLKSYQREKNEIRISKNSNVIKLNRLNSFNKVNDTIKAVDELIIKKEKVVLFSYFTDTIIALGKHFGSKAVVVDGSVSPKVRMDLINKFHNDPKTMVFIGQHVAAGAGINLFNACKGFILDLPFVPSVLSQIIKRLHRRGQERYVDFKLLMIKGTIDTHIYDNILVNKDNDANEILDKDHPKVKKLKELTNQDLVFNSIIKQYEKEIKNETQIKDKSLVN